MAALFSEIDLDVLMDGVWTLVLDRNIKREKDGLWLTDPKAVDTARWVDTDGVVRTQFLHPNRDPNTPVLPFPFTLEQFKTFCDWHPTFEWEAIHDPFENDDDSLDKQALDYIDARSFGAGVLVRHILGIADAGYLRAWEQHCSIDVVQASIREITALKAVTIGEIQYRDGRLKELSDELAKLKQTAPAQTVAKSAYVSGKKWVPEKLAELAAYRAAHTMPETAAKFGISEQRIRDLLPSKKPKAKPFAGLIHRIN